MGTRTGSFVGVVGLLAWACLTGSAVAGALEAQLVFTVPTEGSPCALSYSEGAGQWAVLYRDGTVRFYSSAGAYAGSWVPDLSALGAYGYNDPHLCDMEFVGSFCDALVGDPLATPTAVDAGGVYEVFAFCYTGAPYEAPCFRSVSMLAEAPFALSRYAQWVDGYGSISAGQEVGLDSTGTNLVLQEGYLAGGTQKWLVALADGIIAQDVCLRDVDGNPAVLHDNQISIVQRRAAVVRIGELPYAMYSYVVYPDSEVGTVLENYDIPGLPPDALLVALDQIVDRHVAIPENDRFYVLDQTGGGVYALLPEPATLSLLGLGAIFLLRRRKGAA